ncbi:MAG: FliH/SctL family protein [Acetivibrionales bacterium]|nr:hypothetical protein [Clostridiaceae bacterium]
MYSNKYGYGVYKRNQVNLGAPYKPPKMTESIVEEVFNEAAAASEADPDMDLKIGQDIVHKAKSEAALIKHEAEQEAESIINEAKEKSEAMLAEVLQEAKEEGYRHGEELAQQHYSDLLAEAQDFKERSEREYQETIASFENNIIELVLEISEKVIGKLVEENKDIVLDIVKDTINSCSNRENITLIVSSEDYDVVVENQELLKSSVKGIHKLELREDKSLKKGSCIIDTNFGSVEGSYDVRLESIRKAFFELIGENGQEDGKDDE